MNDKRSNMDGYKWFPDDKRTNEAVPGRENRNISAEKSKECMTGKYGRTETERYSDNDD